MFVAIVATFASCASTNISMKQPNVLVELSKNDFSLSNQVTGQATTTKILGIDFARLFGGKTGDTGAPAISLASIPVWGPILTDKTSGYALYEMMSKNEGYDVVFYPQFEKTVSKPIGLPIYTITTVKVTARLAKVRQ